MQQQSDCVLEKFSVTFLVVGGGIAGVTCAENLSLYCAHESIMLLTESSVIKTVVNLEPVSRYLHKFQVKECLVNSENKSALDPKILIIVDQLCSINSLDKTVTTKAHRIIKYRFLCICTGGLPRLIYPNNPYVLGIRDTDSVVQFQNRLKNAKRIIIVGNGGIASELVHELQGIEIHWVIKDSHITATFVDAGAAHFFQQSRNQNALGLERSQSCTVTKRLHYSEVLLQIQPQGNDSNRGVALGPDWHRNFALTGSLNTDLNTPTMYYNAHITSIETVTDKREVLVSISTGEKISCDFVVSATGVDPHHNFICNEQIKYSIDGGILVNDMMETNLSGIYAAGDVCTSNWPPTLHWHQMRLWTQARQMGAMAGKSMAAALNNESIYQDFCFELFGHVTQFFGYPVVLLGRYNGQGLGTDYEILLRTTPGKEYIKFVLQKGFLRGAILIGNTELAETCENLILNGIDLTPYGDDILNPDIDIEDYFD